MKVRIIPGDFGRYTSGGGSWDNANPDAASFEVELITRPIKGEAVMYRNQNSTGMIDSIAGESLFRIGQVQEVVTSETTIFVFIPTSTVVIK